MTPDEFLQRIWGDDEGYVFLPRRTDYWQETPAIAWPEGGIDVNLNAGTSGDQYFCPNLFKARRRNKDGVEKAKWLYADLDNVNPKRLSLRPTIAIQTSPGRYQGLWELRRPIGARRHESLNQRLTYATGADKGGWHLTKVLRVPGTLNHKYDPPRKVRVLWDSHQTFTTQEIEDYVKGIESHELDPEVKGLILPVETREDILRRVEKSTDRRLQSLVKDRAKPGDEGRSGLLWELECRLLEFGLEPEEVFIVVRESSWNKYRDRHLGDNALWREVSKAHLHIGSNRLENDKGSKTSVVRLRPRLVTYSQLLSSPISEPDWLVEDWWTLGSHGIIAGLPKSYKSLISLDLSVSIASETKFLNLFPVNPKGVGPVLIVQQENSMALLRDRLWRITKSRGLHSGNVGMHRDTVVVEFPPALPIMFYNDFGFDMSQEGDREAIEVIIQQEQIKMVVFDPLYLMIGGADENSAKDIRPILSWLLQLRNLYNCAVVVVHHWGKGALDKHGRGVGGIKLLGSTTIYGWLECGLYLETKITDQGIQIVVESEFRERLAPPPKGYTLSMGNVGESGYVWKQGGPVASTNKILYLITQSGSDGSTYGSLSEATEIGQKKLRAEIAELIQRGEIRVETEGKRKRFYLKEG